MADIREIYMFVKTYPHPSSSHVELVCTAGIMEEQFVRLYPVPFRYLDEEQKFKKYSWIRAEVSPVPDSQDKRPDSYKPSAETIEVLTNPSQPNWEQRYRILRPHIRSSLENIQSRYKDSGHSLGIFKPKNIDLEITESQEEWKPKQKQALQQANLFYGKPKRLAKIPYNFRYTFECDNEQCTGHRMLITDWEIGIAFLNWKTQYGEEGALSRIREKWLNWMWNERDSYLIVGTTHPYPTFIVIGVFYPPKKMAATSAALFDQ